MAPGRIAKQLVLGSSLVWRWSVLRTAVGDSVATMGDAVLTDDECAVAEDCALNALQLRAASGNDPAAPGEGFGDPLIADADPSWEDDSDEENDLGADATGYCTRNSRAKRCGLLRACHGRSYCVFGGYMVVPGRPCAGMESINGGNAHSYDYLFGVARRYCGGPGCVLMTNPVGHRTQDQLHIHFRRTSMMGPVMQSRLQAATCHEDGWVPFHAGCCGCGHSKARAFHGFPGVFSAVASAFGGGSLSSVGISVWFGCGKTIVLATTHCSIEHSVSAR
mmetsp:Transcript_5834/g.16903  ORF Transcript_5834/g.16903 Transcript_5834/m.16903 type:complete len:278 (-) Transcript_5834:114-947(-)